MTKNTNTYALQKLLKNKKSFLALCFFAATNLSMNLIADEELHEEKIAEHRKAMGAATPGSSAVTGGSNVLASSSSHGHSLYFPGYVVPANNFGYAGSTATLVVPITDSPARTILVSPASSAPVAVTSAAVDNAGFGYNVFNALISGTQNVAVGSTALDAATTGSNNVAAGYSALGAVTTGAQNVAVGTSAGGAILTTSDSTAVGYQALLLNTGAQNTAVGSGALDANVAGTPNVAVGYNALGANVSGNNNVAVGASAGLTLLTNQNTVVGASALAAASGANSTAVGYNALNANTAANMTAVGSGALAANIGGTPNTAVGYNALTTNTTGANNVALGSTALTLNLSGARNAAVGTASLATNSTGVDNTAVGYNALNASTSATGNNSGFGSGAGALTTGANNTYLGFSAGSAMTTGNNNIMIGSGTTFQGADSITSSNVIVIRGSTEQTKTYIGGIRGRTTDAADAIAVLVSSTGQLGTVSSSKRFKENIVPVDQATAEKLADLNIVTFTYISDKSGRVQYGAIAEEVFEIFPELIVYNKDGEIETIQYHHFVPLLIKYAQVQNAEIKSLKAVVAALMKRIEALENK